MKRFSLTALSLAALLAGAGSSAYAQPPEPSDQYITVATPVFLLMCDDEQKVDKVAQGWATSYADALSAASKYLKVISSAPFFAKQHLPACVGLVHILDVKVESAKRLPAIQMIGESKYAAWVVKLDHSFGTHAHETIWAVWVDETTEDSI